LDEHLIAVPIAQVLLHLQAESPSQPFEVTVINADQ
jgi:hypothetical protein